MRISKVKGIISLITLVILFIPVMTGDIFGAEPVSINLSKAPQVDLTEEERGWLKAHPVIKVVIDPNWAPVEFLDKEGNLQGMSMDYLHRLEDLLGVRFEIPRGLSWKEMVEAVKNRELDMFASLARTAERENYFLFTEPYVSMPIHIYSSREVAYMGEPGALHGKDVAVMSGYAIEEWLRRDYPGINLVPVKTIPDAFKMLTRGKAQAFIGNAFSAGYYIHKLGLYEVHVVGETPYANNQTMAVRGDWPLLAGILQKALDFIKKEEGEAIINRWMTIRYEHGVDYTLLWQSLLAAAIVLSVFLYWNRRLSGEVNKRRQVEAVLKAQQERLDYVFNATRDGIRDWAIVTDQTYCSPTYFHMLGYKPEDFSANDSQTVWLDMIHPDDLKRTLAETKEHINASDEPYSVEFRMRCKDGRYKWILDRGKVVARDAGGNPTRLVGAHVDIDHFKKLENQLREAKNEAESANRAKSVFLANMSHELRTPLNAILGFSEMLVRECQAGGDQKDKLFIINRSGEHLLNMINDVLDLSKIEAGHVEQERLVFDLPLMLKDIGQMMALRAGSAGLHFNLELDPGLAQYIKADMGKLRQILINLLDNAVTYAGKGGLWLRAGTLPVAGSSAMVMLRLEVEDSGQGIDAEQIERIFEPFVQAGKAGTDLKGSGLGLAISKSFVELMGGKISVTSKPGKGSLFCVELPVALGEAAAAARIHAVQPAVPGLEPGQPEQRILVVEDNRDNRLLLGSLLLQAGFQVKEAENGEEAVTLFDQWRPHLIWMDMRMPVMDGYEATAKIRSMAGGDEVKIIAITASAYNEQRKVILEAGCDEVVHKPFQACEIFHTMAQQLGVRYTYEKEEEVKAEEREIILTSHMLAELPSDLRKILRDTAHKLDISAMDQVIERIRRKRPGIACGLQALVKEFRFDRILELLGGKQ
ncbi:MAG: transporter substrate-binding domain-containing protein [Deltaproteobacteria bacterium]|nr:transporter substrate-binding domain-containing protein [Deltaproteobacteria bacterium]